MGVWKAAGPCANVYCNVDIKYAQAPERPRPSTASFGAFVQKLSYTQSGREVCGRTLTKRTRASFKRAFFHVDAIHSASRATMAAAAEQSAAELKRVDHPIVRHRRFGPLPIHPAPPVGDLQAPGCLASSDGLITCSASPVAQRLVSRSML